MVTSDFEFDVFLSHNSKDKPLVEQIAHKLISKDTKVWLDRWNLIPGNPWQEEIEQALDKCKTYTVFLGPSGIGPWENAEMRTALDVRAKDRQRRVIPVLLPGAPDNHDLQLPPFLANLTWVDFRGGINDPVAFHNLISGINGVAPGPLPVQIAPCHVAFVNREREIDYLTAEETPGHYYVVSAPAGYGKSDLLLELEIRFKKKAGWFPVRALVKRNDSLQDIVNQVSLAFELRLYPNQNRAPGEILGGALVQKFKDQPPAGLVLLIDLDGEPTLKIVEELLEVFIPQVWTSLAELKPFKNQQSRFRVIIAGRNLATTKAAKETSLAIIQRALKPFTFEVVKTSAAQFLCNFEKLVIDTFAADILFLTGGHPGAMAYCFSFIQQQAIPLEQILDHREEIWNGYLRDVCEYGYQALATPELKPVMDSLCIFRYADEFVLQKIFVRSKSPVFHDEFELWDKLAQTNIFENRNRYLKDDISRRLLVIRLRQTQPASYQKLAGEARTICEKHLQQPDLQLPEDWVIEYLYQSLQMVVDGYAMSDQVRATLKRQFTRDLKKALTLYFDRPSFEKGAQRRNGLRILISKMEEDDQWEFRFLVNYLQCGSDFTDAPFTQLLKDVAAWPL